MIRRHSPTFPRRSVIAIQSRTIARLTRELYLARLEARIARGLLEQVRAVAS